MKRRLFIPLFVLSVSALQISSGFAQEVAPPANPAPVEAKRHLTKCPDDLTGYENSDATDKFVEKCMGVSKTKTKKDDGTHTSLYELRNGVIVVFLFDKDGLIIRAAAYAKN